MAKKLFSIIFVLIFLVATYFLLIGIALKIRNQNIDRSDFLRNEQSLVLEKML